MDSDIGQDEPEFVGARLAKDLGQAFSKIVEPITVSREAATVNRESLSRSNSSLAASKASFRRLQSLPPTAPSSALPELPKLPPLDENGTQPPGTAASKLLWSPSRRELEFKIEEEKAASFSRAKTGEADDDEALLSSEQRLEQRLGKLKLEMHVMRGDGNCQFRSISYGLYGSPSYHRIVRRKAVEHLRAHPQDFEAFLGESFASYCDDMESSGTWGDELTLRAVSDAYGVVINVVTSDQQHWFMRYVPPDLKLTIEVFLTYIAPVHYNAIQRRTSLLRNLSRRNSGRSRIQDSLDEYELAAEPGAQLAPIPSAL